MISYKLTLYCIVLGGAYLAIITTALELASVRLRISRDMPEDLLEPVGFAWHLLNYMMEGLFFVAIPTLIYSFFSVILPLSGIRPGMAAALLVITLGALPTIMGLSVRLKLPMLFMLYSLFGLILKLGGCLAIIGYLYSI